MPAGVMRSIGVSADVHEQDVVLVVDLVVTGLERDAAGAEAVVFRDQFLGDVRVFDALADLPGDEVAITRRWPRDRSRCHEIALPHAEAAAGIQAFP